ncbi:rhomboid family intramembrane serine protease [Ignicoccus hospitalis]|nr:rhomboid family intramembrane serine protease [Ignicoccus hospitalis]HIH90387.1 rhomboid family intramembrane serine protease [Desulfurococcaceae archaeon]
MIPLYDINAVRGKSIINTAIITINVLVFVVLELPLLLQGNVLSFNELVKNYGMVPYFVVNGMREYTLLTHMWLHGSLEHIAGNMLFLYIFGDNVEAVLGRRGYLALYLLSGLGAVVFHLLSVMLTPSIILNPYLRQNPWLTPAIGASGAISGVLAAYMLFFPHAQVMTLVFAPYPLLIPIRASVFIGLWFLYQLIMGTWSLSGMPTGVAWWAHIGGFLTGAALAYLLADRNRIIELRLRGRYVVYI